MSHYRQTLDSLKSKPRAWLVTGGAGFIGSHLVESLLKLNQRVTALDDLSTGTQDNLAMVQSRVPASVWKYFRFIEGSVCDATTSRDACAGIDHVLHEAGFVSVPLSIENPLRCNAVNVDGFLQILLAARVAGVKSLVYASSSAVYGDDPAMPKIEEKIGSPLSPYGASKLIDELYAGVFHKTHGLAAIGLRYFNVFGPRQNPEGGYAAVIPAWISAIIAGRDCVINGDRGITRDFVHIDNVVQANILAATTQNSAASGEAFNVGNGGQTTLADLYQMIASKLGSTRPVILGPPRPGDILHSGADISKIRRLLGYEPAVTVDSGLDETVRWYAEQRNAG